MEEIYKYTPIHNDEELIDCLSRLDSIIGERLERWQGVEPYDMNDEKLLGIYSDINHLLISIQSTSYSDI